jgi:alanine racemase
MLAIKKNIWPYVESALSRNMNCNSGNETILSVDLSKLTANFYYLKSKLNPKTKIIAVVKAFAYGHGDIEIAKKIEALGVYGFWVTDFEEGVGLRVAGIKGKIIVANPGMKSYEKIIKYNLDVVIYNNQLLELYSNKKHSVNVHLKFNTGMNRYGFNKNELNNVVVKTQKNPHLNILSICTHLASSEKKKTKRFTLKQISLFKNIAYEFENLIDRKVLKHSLNSHGVINYSQHEMDMVRLGIGLYGSANDENLYPISSLKSVITQIRKVNVGDPIGYGDSFMAKGNMSVAVVPVGYADGLNRRLSNNVGKVMINNSLCPIVGKISMGTFCVDVSNIIAKEGDQVEIFGDNISVITIAAHLKTIPYEIYSTLNRRIKRVYF